MVTANTEVMHPLEMPVWQVRGATGSFNVIFNDTGHVLKWKHKKILHDVDNTWVS